MPDQDSERLAFLGGRPHPAFALCRFALGPGKRHAYDPREWQDSLVVIERGAVELECRSGASRTFSGGAVLWFAGLPLRAIHNHGNDTALLVAVRRRNRSTRPMSLDAQGRFKE
jgi:hypothetical protein